METTVPIYGVKPMSKITVTIPCKITTPSGNQNLSTYMDRLSNLVDNLVQSKDLPAAKTSIQFLLTEIRTTNTSISFP
jgi:hypothetical protein